MVYKFLKMIIMANVKNFLVATDVFAKISHRIKEEFSLELVNFLIFLVGLILELSLIT